MSTAEPRGLFGGALSRGGVGVPAAAAGLAPAAPARPFSAGAAPVAAACAPALPDGAAAPGAAGRAVLLASPISSERT